MASYKNLKVHITQMILCGFGDDNDNEVIDAPVAVAGTSDDNVAALRTCK